MWEQISTILGVLLGGTSLIILVVKYIRRDTQRDDNLQKVCETLNKYDLGQIHLMVTTMWQAYTSDLPHRRPDLAENHSPCSLTPAGLEMIPAEIKAELDRVNLLPDDRENVVTGYLVTKILGMERINLMAKINHVLVQEMIGILSTYLDCRLSEKK